MKHGADNVVFNRLTHHQAARHTVLGDIADTVADSVLIATQPHRLAIYQDLAAVRAGHAEKAQAQLCSPGAQQADYRHYFSGFDLQGDVMIFPLAAEIAHLQHRRTALPLPQIAHLIVKLLARHQKTEPAGGYLCRRQGADQIAILQHADAVRYGHDLFQTVAYEDDADPPLTQLAHHMQ